MLNLFQHPLDNGNHRGPDDYREHGGKLKKGSLPDQNRDRDDRTTSAVNQSRQSKPSC